jgi:hypothetical protein
MLKRARAAAFAAVPTAALLLAAAGCAAPHDGPVSPHFDGTHFRNP